MSDQKRSNETRKRYRKPEITQVRLVPEQAVLAGCKAALQVGPQEIGCELSLGGECLIIGT